MTRTRGEYEHADRRYQCPSCFFPLSFFPVLSLFLHLIALLFYHFCLRGMLVVLISFDTRVSSLQLAAAGFNVWRLRREVL